MMNNDLAKVTTRASDNRQNGARNVGSLNGSKKFQGSVGVGDKIDFYSFTLSGRSSFNLSLNKLKSNVDVSLLQNGKVLSRSVRSSGSPEAINTTLEDV